MSTRRRIGDIRALERVALRQYNDNGVYLDNPDASPAFDKHKPIPSDDKALALGFEPDDPKRLWQLPRGDAGAGQTAFRRARFFYSIALTSPPAPVVLAGSAAGSPYSLPIGLATQRSSDSRLRYFHVSMYGIGARRPDLGVPLVPLTQDEILSQQFESIYTETAPGVFTELTTRFVPSVCTLQARVMIHDESGQRFFDADVIGSRSFNIYAFAVTIFALIKADGYEVDFQNPDSIEPLVGGGIGVEDDIVGGRVVPIFRNRTENFQNRTIGVTIDPAVPAGSLGTVVPMPPGTRKVQIFSDSPTPGADWVVEFWYGRMPLATAAGAGRIDFNAGQSRTSIIDVPNSSAIVFRANNPAVPITSFLLVFEVDQ